MTKKIVVTGASGFIGRHVVPLLLARDYEIMAMGRNLDSFNGFDWSKNVELVQTDIHAAPNSQIDLSGYGLLHLAWDGLPNYKDNFHFSQNLPHHFNFLQNLVQSGVEKILVTGTCFEYGMVNGPLAADQDTHPENPYAFAKDCLRQQLEYLQDQHRFDLKWARLFYMYGEGQNSKSILPLLDQAIDRGEAIFNMSGGEQLRDYLPVETVAQQLVTLYESAQVGKFNICSGKPITIRTLVEDHIAKRKSNIKLNLGFYPYPDYEPMAFWGDA
jgi:nucleoside-diphosphate-sugar epimerase